MYSLKFQSSLYGRLHKHLSVWFIRRRLLVSIGIQFLYVKCLCLKKKRRKTFITLNHAVFLANYQKKIDYCGLPNVIFYKILAEEFSIVWTSKEIEFPQ